MPGQRGAEWLPEEAIELLALSGDLERLARQRDEEGHEVPNLLRALAQELRSPRLPELNPAIRADDLLWSIFDVLETAILMLAGQTPKQAAETVGRLLRVRSRFDDPAEIRSGVSNLADEYERVSSEWELLEVAARRRAIRDAIQSSHLLVAVYGNGWLESSDELLTSGGDPVGYLTALAAMALKGGFDALVAMVEAINDRDLRRALVAVVGGESAWLAMSALSVQASRRSRWRIQHVGA